MSGESEGIGSFALVRESEDLQELCSSYPGLTSSTPRELVTFLAEMVKSPPNPHLLDLALWVLVKLLETDDELVTAYARECGVAQSMLPLMESDEPSILHSVLRCITKLMEGAHNHINALIAAGLLKHLEDSLDFVSHIIQEMAIKCLCEIAYDCEEHRNLILQEGFFHLILDYLDSPCAFAYLMPSVLVFLDALYTHQHPPASKYNKSCLELLHTNLKLSSDPAILSLICYIYEKLLCNKYSEIDDVYELNVPYHLSLLIRQSDKVLRRKALKVVGHLLNRIEPRTDRVLSKEEVDLYCTFWEVQAKQERKNAMLLMTSAAAEEPDTGINEAALFN